MCPSCMANVAAMVFGLTSIGGLTAFTWNRNSEGQQETERQDKNLLDQKEENYG